MPLLGDYGIAVVGGLIDRRNVIPAVGVADIVGVGVARMGLLGAGGRWAIGQSALA